MERLKGNQARQQSRAVFKKFNRLLLVTGELLIRAEIRTLVSPANIFHA
jgi:hypothetical protein